MHTLSKPNFWDGLRASTNICVKPQQLSVHCVPPQAFQHITEPIYWLGKFNNAFDIGIIITCRANCSSCELPIITTTAEVPCFFPLLLCVLTFLLTTVQHCKKQFRGKNKARGLLQSITTLAKTIGHLNPSMYILSENL